MELYGVRFGPQWRFYRGQGAAILLVLELLIWYAEINFIFLQLLLSVYPLSIYFNVP